MAWLKEIEWPFKSAIFDGEACSGDGHEGIQAVFTERNASVRTCRSCSLMCSTCRAAV